MDDYIKDLKKDEKTAFEEEISGYNKQRDVGNICGPWLAGIALIAVGTIFLLGNFTNFYLNNWWALFILIPAFGKLGRAGSSFQRHGRFTSNIRRSLMGGLVLTVVAITFLLNLDWGTIWPVFLIVFGIGALLSGLFD